MHSDRDTDIPHITFINSESHENRVRRLPIAGVEFLSRPIFARIFCCRRIFLSKIGAARIEFAARRVTRAVEHRNASRCRFRSAAYRSLISGHGDVVVARAHARNILEWTRVHNAEAGESTTFISTMISSTNSNGRETRVGSCAASSSCSLTATRRAATLDEKKLSVE